MTYTVGYYCDPCRTKYVQHLCKEGLPCGHPKEEAVHVYAKNYGRGDEFVEMTGPGDYRVSIQVARKRDDGKVLYAGYMARVLHGQVIRSGPGEGMTLFEWLNKQDALIIRAFLARWESNKYMPAWRMIELGPAEQMNSEEAA